jgi:CheY-like chemotaxis protein
MRILILDDVDGRHLVIAGRFPTDERVHVKSTSEAIAALGPTAPRFDLALLDHDLGEDPLNGVDVARAIAALPPQSRPTLVIIHSHNPNGAERMRDILLDVQIDVRIEPFSGLRKR